jgi:carbon storage regulator
MLVLTRKVGEKIIIGDDIVITVVRLNHDKVRLGIDAPPHIQVHRLEVIERDRLANASPTKDAGSLPLSAS